MRLKAFLNVFRFEWRIKFGSKRQRINYYLKKNLREGWDEAFKKAGSKKESAMVNGDGMDLSS